MARLSMETLEVGFRIASRFASLCPQTARVYKPPSDNIDVKSSDTIHYYRRPPHLEDPLHCEFDLSHGFLHLPDDALLYISL